MRLPPVLKRALRQPFVVSRPLDPRAPSWSDALAVFALAVDPAGRPPVARPASPARVWRPGECRAAPAAATFDRHPDLPPVPGIGEARIRPRRRRSRSVDRGLQGTFPSMKMGRSMHRASRGERAAMLDCELSGDVTIFCEQPVGLVVEVDGRRGRYTPDILRVRAGRVELIEVRPEASASSPENERRWQAIGEQVAAMGVTFLVQAEGDLLHTERWGRLCAVWRDRHAEPPSGGKLLHVREVLSDIGNCTVEALVADVPGLSRREVHAAIRRGLLAADFDADGVGLTLPPLGTAFPVRWGAVP